MRILAMSGFVPEQICDTVRFTQYRGDRNLSHYCGYASDFVSQVLEEDWIDGAVFPKSCDSTRAMAGYLAGTRKFIYQIPVPTRRDEAAVDFFASVISDYKASVERHFCISLDDTAERCAMLNKRNAALRKQYRELDTVSYAEYLKGVHGMLREPLYGQSVPAGLQAKRLGGHRVFLVGSFLSNTAVAEKMENAGLVVVGDTLPESGRLISGNDVQLSGDIYRAIASSLLSKRLAPTQNDFRQILRRDLEEMEARNVEAVVFVVQKYCEPYDYLFSVYKKALDELGIPVLRLQLTDSEDEKNVELSVEAFADTLG